MAKRDVKEAPKQEPAKTEEPQSAVDAAIEIAQSLQDSETDVADMLGTAAADDVESAGTPTELAAEVKRPNHLHGPCPVEDCDGRLGSSGTRKMKAAGDRVVRVRDLICRLCSENAGKEILS